MLMSKGDRIKIYEYLFKEGVLVAKKDFHAPKHTDIDVPNLHVIKAVQSLVSKKYVKEQFCWRHYYWSLTNEGISYLREFLHLPPEIVPATLKRQAQAPRTDAGKSRPRGPDAGGRSGPEERGGYRRNVGGADKKGEAGAGTGSFQFRGGFGRGGAPAQQQPEQE